MMMKNGAWNAPVLLMLFAMLAEPKLLPFKRHVIADDVQSMANVLKPGKFMPVLTPKETWVLPGLPQWIVPNSVLVALTVSMMSISPHAGQPMLPMLAPNIQNAGQ